MTLANRAIGAPINIWNDHSDAMALRDAGWIQLFAETNQEAADLHVQAFRLAEELSLPVMVCMDGFILTHAFERIDMPEQAAGRRLPAALRAPPGARSGRPDVDRRHGRPRGVRPRSATSPTSASSQRSSASRTCRREFAESFGRDSGGLVRPYRTDDAETVVVALGSVLGTIKDAVDELRADGDARRRRSGSPRSGRSPLEAVRDALARRRRCGRGREGIQRRASAAVLST